MLGEWIKVGTSLGDAPAVGLMAATLAADDRARLAMSLMPVGLFGGPCDGCPRGSVGENDGTVRAHGARSGARADEVAERVMRSVVVDGLLRVWSVAVRKGDRGATEDGGADDAVVDCWTAEAIDRVAQCPGFADAMARVGWLRLEDDGPLPRAVFPKLLREQDLLSEARGAKSRSAQRGREYRAKKRAEKEAAERAPAGDGAIETSAHASARPNAGERALSATEERRGEERRKNPPPPRSDVRSAGREQRVDGGGGGFSPVGGVTWDAENPDAGPGVRRWRGVTDGVVDEWSRRYPGLDIRAELDNSDEWLSGRPSKGGNAARIFEDRLRDVFANPAWRSGNGRTASAVAAAHAAFDALADDDGGTEGGVS